jgi:hypothetical protein
MPYAPEGATGVQKKNVGLHGYAYRLVLGSWRFLEVTVGQACIGEMCFGREMLGKWQLGKAGRIFKYTFK